MIRRQYVYSAIFVNGSTISRMSSIKLPFSLTRCSYFALFHPPVLFAKKNFLFKKENKNYQNHIWSWRKETWTPKKSQLDVWLEEWALMTRVRLQHHHQVDNYLYNTRIMYRIILVRQLKSLCKLEYFLQLELDYFCLFCIFYNQQIT